MGLRLGFLSLFCLLLQSPPAVWATPPRPGVAEKCGGAYASLLLEDSNLERVFHDGFKGIFLDSMNPGRAPADSMSAAEFTRRTLTLSELERARLLSIARGTSAPFERRNERKMALLALYDDEAWEGFFKEISSEGMNSYFRQALPDVLASAPPAFKERVRNRISATYENSVRSKNIPSRNPELPHPTAKRGYDFLMRHLFRREAQIRKNVEAGRTPLKALSQYLNEVRADLGWDAKPGYDEKAILAVAQAIQRALTKAQSTQVVTLGGSFVNGRAIPGVSDIDAFLQNNYRTIPQELRDQLKRAVESTLKKRSLANFKYSDHVSTPQETAALSELSPVALRITSDRIELLVYPPQPLGGVFDRYRREFPNPEIYPLSAVGASYR